MFVNLNLFIGEGYLEQRIRMGAKMLHAIPRKQFSPGRTVIFLTMTRFFLGEREQKTIRDNSETPNCH